MKAKIYICFTWVCLAVCVACHSGSENDGTEEGQTREVSFAVSQSDDLFARSVSSGFEVGDSIGIYAVKRDVSGEIGIPGKTGNQAHNAKWIKTLEGWTPASLKDKIVYPQDGAELDFYAYYPYNRNATAPDEISMAVQTEQGTEENLKKSDWMRASNTEGISEGEVELKFQHVLSCAEVQVQTGGVAPDAGLEVHVTGVNTVCTYNLGAGTFLGESEVGTIVMQRLDAPGESGSLTFKALLPAQAIAAETPLFRCLQNGKIYIYRSEGIEFTEGNRTRFIFTLKGGGE